MLTPRPVAIISRSVSEACALVIEAKVGPDLRRKIDHQIVQWMTWPQRQKVDAGQVV